MGNVKLSGAGWGRIFMGAAQIAVIVSLGMYFIFVIADKIILAIVLSVLIGALAGAAVVGRSGKEAALKWIISIPLYWILMVIFAKTQVNHRLFQELNGYDRWSGDGFGLLIGIVCAAFWSLVFMGIGAWFSGHRKRAGKTKQSF